MVGPLDHPAPNISMYGDGRVLTTIFASSIRRGEHSGYGVPDSLVADALARARGTVSTGPCTR